jgi:putative two-component system response regulator
MVVTDWMMPNMDGLELCKRIRSMGLPSYVYIIILTARSETTDVVAGLAAGADEFLGKPVHPAELKSRIRAGERILSLESRHVAIFGMAKLAESRDPETGLHLERIREYARVLCKALVASGVHGETLTPEYIETIYLTSPLHDIGKVGIPDAVLLKPGQLDDEEFEVMKTHTTLAGETLGMAARLYPGVRYLHMACDIALSHHERYDGRGYPLGKAGDDIPLCGRIVCLADVYDALTSRRVYKTAYTHSIARSMIRDERGMHFDPNLVDAFMASEGEIKDIRRKFSEQSQNDGDMAPRGRALHRPAVPSFLRG